MLLINPFIDNIDNEEQILIKKRARKRVLRTLQLFFAKEVRKAVFQLTLAETVEITEKDRQSQPGVQANPEKLRVLHYKVKVAAADIAVWQERLDGIHAEIASFPDYDSLPY